LGESVKGKEGRKPLPPEEGKIAPLSPAEIFGTLLRGVLKVRLELVNY